MTGAHRPPPRAVFDLAQQAQLLQAEGHAAAHHHHVGIEDVEHVAQPDDDRAHRGFYHLQGHVVAPRGGGEYCLAGQRRVGFVGPLQRRAGGGVSQTGLGRSGDGGAGRQCFEAAAVAARTGRRVGTQINGHVPNFASRSHRAGEHLSSVDDPRSDAGAEGYENQRSRRRVLRSHRPSGPVIILAQGRQVGIVAHPNRRAQQWLPKRGQHDPVQGRQVGRGQQHVAGRVNRTGQSDSGAGNRASSSPILRRLQQPTGGVHQLVLQRSWLVGDPVLPQDGPLPVDNRGAGPGSAPVHRQRHGRVLSVNVAFRRGHLRASGARDCITRPVVGTGQPPCIGTSDSNSSSAPRSTSSGIGPTYLRRTTPPASMKNFSGMPRTPYSRAIDPSASTPVG